jgi:flagellar motility protein MotE (MotC chaperone)
MNTQQTQTATVNHEIVPPRAHRRRFLPYLSVIILMLLCLGLAVLLDILPPPDSAYSTGQNQVSDQPQVSSPPPESLLTVTTADVPLLTSLQKRQARLEAIEAKEHHLTEREEALRQVQQQIVSQLQTLTTLRQEITELLAEKEAFEEQRLGHLVKVYEGMRPAEAASLVERLDEDTAVRLFFRMKEKKISKILEAVKPDVAARLSERLAALQQSGGEAIQTP